MSQILNCTTGASYSLYTLLRVLFIYMSMSQSVERYDAHVIVLYQWSERRILTIGVL